MIVVDSSAIVAIALAEAEATQFAKLIVNTTCWIAAPTVLETHMVLTGRVPARVDLFMRGFLSQDNIKVEPFDQMMSLIACEAIVRFGRSHHSARLNFGDCISYAFAKSRDLPLLFKGNDFPLTDIRPACRP